jgi:site-specific recombinase XerD
MDINFNGGIHVMSLTVQELITRGDQFLRTHNYAERTVNIYHSVWRWFKQYCLETNRGQPTREDIPAFFASRGMPEGRKLTHWQRQQHRIVKCLFDIGENGESPPRAYGHVRILLPDCYTQVYAAYQSYLQPKELAERTVYGKSHHAKKFLNYLESVGVRDIRKLRASHVNDYLSSIRSVTSKVNSATKFFLREFLRFLVETFEADPVLATLFPVILENKKDSLPSVYEAEELSAVLAALDDNAPTAKRTRAILMLALQLGMRVGDIKGLRKDQIDWTLKKITFAQQKTGRQIVLPLPEECQFALLDYLKNERPAADEPRIFITRNAPYRALADCNNYHSPVSDSYKRAGVNVEQKHHGLHSVRHSVAVNMLLSGTPYPVVTGVLGHENPNTTKLYLRMDVERLRALCLEVPHA